ncbi:OB-fold protein [Paraburkholderia saeva]|uniref:OB-fold protein n=1 Tax=Paraburkholderia saeva TaxID=2777537 RepID=UPI001D618882|nr:hypothetical protein [Paraburkholderia saeva]CAG4911645.1 hypothetical protein R52603_03947 [Paraburkholderia saeva]
MALIKCDECGADVSDKAVACPKCGNPIHAEASIISAARASASRGAPPPQSKASVRRKFGGALVAFLVALVAFMVYESQSTNSSTTSASASASGSPTVAQTTTTSPADASAAEQAAPAPAPTRASPPVIRISAPQLYEEYKANEVLADTKYKGRWLYVSGIVDTIGKDVLDDPYVTLVGEDEFETVQAMFGKSAIQQLAQLHKGEQVSLMCRGNGKTFINVMLDCTSDDTPPAPQHTQATATAAPSESAPATQAADMPAPAASAPEANYTTSFDCTKAHSTSEILICGDPDLAALDVELAQLYAQAKAAAPDKQAFANMTRQNWNWREKNCRDKACLIGWYADQKQRFTDIIAQSTRAGLGQISAATQTTPAPAAVASYPTSFDCSAPTFLDEKAICGDPGLAAMDVEMAAEYAAVMKRSTNQAKLESDQNDWHAVRRDCASDLNCLRHAYGVRIGQLRRS